jgi:Flp pilus assembly protein TadB
MALPPFVGFAQASIAPENFKLLLGDPLGVKMLIGAGVLQMLGMLVISRLVKVEY